MNRSSFPWLAALVLLAHGAVAGPVRVSFLSTDGTREDTLRILAEAGCVPENLAALRKAILHYYRTPLALDVSAFPPNADGFHEFASIGDFVAALGTNQLSFLPHAFELNCFDAALLLAAPDMGAAADLPSRNGPYYAIHVTTNFHERMVPVSSLGDISAIAYPARYASWVKENMGMEFSEKHKTLVAVFYQYQTLPLGTAANAVSAETQTALRRHWRRCGLRFPGKLSLVLLHRASLHGSLVATDHVGVLLQRDEGDVYLEKTGGRGPFLRIDVEDPADVAAYFSTVTWPDYPFNCLSIDDDRFLDVPLRPGPPSPAPAPATAAP